VPFIHQWIYSLDRLFSPQHSLDGGLVLAKAAIWAQGNVSRPNAQRHPRPLRSKTLLASAPLAAEFPSSWPKNRSQSQVESRKRTILVAISRHQDQIIGRKYMSRGALTAAPRQERYCCRKRDAVLHTRLCNAAVAAKRSAFLPDVRAHTRIPFLGPQTLLADAALTTCLVSMYPT
jgi:hypothetical protein